MGCWTKQRRDQVDQNFEGRAHAAAKRREIWKRSLLEMVGSKQQCDKYWDFAKDLKKQWEKNKNW